MNAETMKTYTSALLAAFACATVAVGAEAQQLPSLAVEVRGGATLPTPDVVEGSSGGAAPSVSGAVEIRITRVLSVYGGYSRYELQPRRDYNRPASGFDLGARADIPNSTRVAPWVRGGLLLHTAEAAFPASRDPSPVLSESAVGMELGGGAAVTLVPGVELTPGIRYRRYDATYDVSDRFENGGTTTLPVRFLLLDVGLRVHF